MNIYVFWFLKTAILMLFLSSCTPQTNEDVNDVDNNTSRYPTEMTFNAIATTVLVKPSVKSPVDSPNFETELTRITNRIMQNDPLMDANGQRIIRGNGHPYPKTQSWNQDMSLLHLRYRFYNADTLDELNLTSVTDDLSALYRVNGDLSEMKWSSIDPKVYYGIYGSQFWKSTFNAQNSAINFDLVKDFSAVSYDRFTLGKFEGNIDFNDEKVVFAARKTGEKYLTAIVYNMKDDVVLKTLDLADIAWPDEDVGQVFDWLSISPLGNHILISTDDSIQQYDLNLNVVRQLANSGGHGDMGVDVNG